MAPGLGPGAVWLPGAGFVAAARRRVEILVVQLFAAEQHIGEHHQHVQVGALLDEADAEFGRKREEVPLASGAPPVWWRILTQSTRRATRLRQSSCRMVRTEWPGHASSPSRFCAAQSPCFTSRSRNAASAGEAK